MSKLAVFSEWAHALKLKMAYNLLSTFNLRGGFMTVQDCTDRDDWDVRLWREAAEYWEHVPEGKAISRKDASYTSYLDDHPVTTLEFIAYVIVDIFSVFCNSLKDSNLAKKYFSEVSMLTGSAEFTTVKKYLNYIEIFTKSDNLVKPLRERTIVVYGNTEGTKLNSDGTLANNVCADEVELWEQTAKKAAQVSDWVIPTVDVGQCFVQDAIAVGFLKGIGSVAAIILSGYGLYEELTRWYTGNIVRADASSPEKLADGFIWKMREEDYIHSVIKMAMNVSYIALGVLGLLAISGFAFGSVMTTCAFTGTTSNLLSHFWDKIVIDSLHRKQQQAIV